MNDPANDFSAAEAKAVEAERLAAAGDAAAGSLFYRLSTRSLEQQGEFNRAAAAAMLELVRTCQGAIRAQETRLGQIEQQVGALLVFSERLHELHEQLKETREEAQESRDAITEVQEAIDAERAAHRDAIIEVQQAIDAERAAHRDAVEEVREQQRQAIERLLNEQREKIQHILDEQRVSFRQLALQTSEEAVLADRARRATEARLEELSERLNQLSSSRSEEEK